MNDINIVGEAISEEERLLTQALVIIMMAKELLRGDESEWNDMASTWMRFVRKYRSINNQDKDDGPEWNRK